MRKLRLREAHRGCITTPRQSRLRLAPQPTCSLPEWQSVKHRSSEIPQCSTRWSCHRAAAPVSLYLSESPRPPAVGHCSCAWSKGPPGAFSGCTTKKPGPAFHAPSSTFQHLPWTSMGLWFWPTQKNMGARTMHPAHESQGSAPLLTLRAESFHL